MRALSNVSNKICSLVSAIIAEVGPRLWPTILKAENILEDGISNNKTL